MTKHTKILTDDPTKIRAAIAEMTLAIDHELAGHVVNLPLESVFWFVPLNYRGAGKTGSHKPVVSVSKKTGAAKDTADSGFVYDDMLSKIRAAMQPWHGTNVVPVMTLATAAKLLGIGVETLIERIRQNLADLGQAKDSRAQIWTDVAKITHLGAFGYCRSCTIADAIVDAQAIDKRSQFVVPTIQRNYSNLLELRDEQLRENEARERGVKTTDMRDLFPVLLEFVDAGVTVSRESDISRILSVSRGKRQQLWSLLRLVRLDESYRPRLLGDCDKDRIVPANRILPADLWHSESGALADVVSAEEALTSAKTPEARKEAKAALDAAIEEGLPKVESFVRALVDGNVKRSAGAAGKKAFEELLKGCKAGSLGYDLAEALLSNTLAGFVNKNPIFQQKTKAILASGLTPGAKTPVPAPKAAQGKTTKSAK